MVTDNKQKVLIRSMSTEEIEKYMINSDLNGKIIPKNEDTWHQNYNHVSSHEITSSTLTNESKTNLYNIFFNRTKYIPFYKNILDTKSDKFHNVSNPGGSGLIYIIICFRPLIEYKE